MFTENLQFICISNIMVTYILQKKNIFCLMRINKVVNQSGQNLTIKMMYGILATRS